jgi:hypothetical protein
MRKLPGGIQTMPSGGGPAGTERLPSHGRHASKSASPPSMVATPTTAMRKTPEKATGAFAEFAVARRCFATLFMPAF